MNEPQSEAGEITQQEIDAVAGKLETFVQGLPERERQVLELALARGAAATQGDVSGLALPPRIPFSTQLGLLTGLTPVGFGESSGLPGRRVGFGESSGLPSQRVG